MPTTKVFKTICTLTLLITIITYLNLDNESASAAAPPPQQPACTRTVNPGQKIQPTLNQANPGDVICIAPGNYSEELDLTRSGTNNQPITIRALDPNNRPVVDGRAGVDCGGGDCGFPTGNVGRCSPPDKGGRCFIYDALFRVNASHVIIDGLELARSMGATMYVGTHQDPVQNFTLRNSHLHNARHRNLVFTNASNIKVHDNRFNHSGMFAPYSRPGTLNWGANFSMIDTDGADVRRNIIHSTWGEGIIFDGQDYNSRNVTLEDNIIFDTWRSSINIHGARDSKINRNFIFQTNTPNGREFTSIPDNPIQGMVVRSTEPQDNFTPIRSQNITITNNIVVNRRHGLGINEVDNVLIANNTYINCTESCMRQTIANSTGVRIVNNILSHNVNFEPFDGPASNLNFKTNHWTTQPKVDARDNGDIVSPTIFEFGSIALPYTPNASYTQLRTLAENFRLRSNSPDVDAGTNNSEVDKDYFLGDRPTGGNTDIGAHEFGSTPEDPGGEGPPPIDDQPPGNGNSPTPTTTYPYPTAAVPTRDPNATPTPTPNPAVMLCSQECQAIPSGEYIGGYCSTPCNNNDKNIGDCNGAAGNCCCHPPEIRAASGPTPGPPPQIINTSDVPRICQLTSVVNSILNVTLSLAGILTFIYTILSGYQFLTAGTNAEQAANDRAGITCGVIGLVLVVVSFFILLIIKQFTGINVIEFTIPLIGIDRPTECI